MSVIAGTADLEGRSRARGATRAHGRAGASRVFIVVVAALLLGAVAFKAYRLTLPTDGWLLDGPVGAPTFAEDLLGGPSQIRAGDVLLAVDGVPYFDVVGSAVALHRPGIDYRNGAVSVYSAWRDGATTDLEVPLRRWTARGVGLAAWRTLTDTSFGGIYRWLAWLIAAFLFARRPTNRAVKLLFLVESLTVSMAISAAVAPVTVADTLSPLVFYGARVWGELLNWLALPPLTLHFLLVFPDARPVRGWLLAVIYALPLLVLVVVWTTGVVALVPLMAALYSVASVAAVAVLVVRHGSGPARASVRWLAFGFALSGILSLLFWLDFAAMVPGLSGALHVLAEHCICDLVYVTCIAIALLRYQLFDIDVIIRRTLVYGGLTLCVVAVYVALVGGAGRLLGGGADVPLSLASAGVLALALDPLRARLQRGVNRLVYGYRDEPYALLQNLGQRLELAEGPGPAVQVAARGIAEALRLPYVAVEVGAATVARHGTPTLGAERFAMLHGGAEVGALVVAPRVGEDHLTRADRGLLEVLAGQVAKVVHALVLEADLLRSRLASLNVREEARRRLGSDLHDDVGSRLTALVRQAERVGALVDADPAASKAALTLLVDDIKATARRVRSLAHQLHPPELALLGLVEAVRERLTSLENVHGLQVHLEAAELGDLPAAVELGAYGVIQEALANVVQHASATTCWVRLCLGAGGCTSDPSRCLGEHASGAEADDGAIGLLGSRYLEVEVLDDGGGLQPSAGRGGLGLSSMRARAAELGGALSLTQAANGGTLVRLSIPVPAVRLGGSG